MRLTQLPTRRPRAVKRARRVATHPLPAASVRVPGGRGWFVVCSRFGRVDRVQRDCETRASTRSALDPHAATVGDDQVADDRQADPRTRRLRSITPLEPLERVEDAAAV